MGGIVQAPLSDGCYLISYPDKPNESKKTLIPQELVDPNTDKENFVILFIGLAQHGKTTTLTNLFGENLEGKVDNNSGKRKINVLRHPKDKSLVFLDVPGVVASDKDYSEKKIEGEILNIQREVGDPDIIIVCRNFTHAQTGDYGVLKKLVNAMSRKFSRAHLLLVYTRSADAPDLGILNKNETQKEIAKYQQPPYNYGAKAAKHAAFRNMRVEQANDERFHRVFFIENDADEEGILPDKTKCWYPLVNALAKISPSNITKEFLSTKAAQCLKTMKVNEAARTICPACKLRGDNDELKDCEFCNVPLIQQNF